MGKTIIEETPNITSDFLADIKKLTILYNSDEDVFFIKQVDPQPAVSYDLDGEIWLRFDPVSKDIVGFEIENFETVFMKKFPEVAKVWKEAKPLCDHKKTRVVEDDQICSTFITILLSFFKDILKNNPQQTSFNVT